MTCHMSVYKYIEKPCRWLTLIDYCYWQYHCQTSLNKGQPVVAISCNSWLYMWSTSISSPSTVKIVIFPELLFNLQRVLVNRIHILNSKNVTYELWGPPALGGTWIKDINKGRTGFPVEGGGTGQKKRSYSHLPRGLHQIMRKPSILIFFLCVCNKWNALSQLFSLQQNRDENP